ncbi:VIT1/CCC1 transporter family protein [Pseudaquidulcibacter saccharophilus]|uniref:VIT1/CCC1 transporter family protein n=1 Tax=Pseudaquidulcibacter saccharophilus TaxID=2831900 RepID=UPI001EFEF6F7|nr:VIT family protein [Pseudaquidulcibacter saccharophilus]
MKKEIHFIDRVGWLRAAVLGANDGIISTASLIAGIAATNATKPAIFFTGIAALVAGALSMAAGEYVSVSSQLDTENADLEREKYELENFPDAEKKELQDIYIKRGLSPELALSVAEELMKNNALEAHSRDELGISEHLSAKPVQAAIASALTFAAGAVLPILVILLSPREYSVWAVSLSSIIFLALLGVVGARAGGANIMKSVIRVTFWGALALIVTASIGKLFGTNL